MSRRDYVKLAASLRKLRKESEAEDEAHDFFRGFHATYEIIVETLREDNISFDALRFHDAVFNIGIDDAK